MYPKVKKLKPGDARQCGIDNKPVAVAAYLSLMLCFDKDIPTEETGLQIHQEYPYLAVSPDRIVLEGNDKGILEVKCLASK